MIASGYHDVTVTGRGGVPVKVKLKPHIRFITRRGRSGVIGVSHIITHVNAWVMNPMKTGGRFFLFEVKYGCEQYSYWSVDNFADRRGRRPDFSDLEIGLTARPVVRVCKNCFKRASGYINDDLQARLGWE